MSLERLYTTMSIENDMFENIDADVIINDFASHKARRNQVLMTYNK